MNLSSLFQQSPSFGLRRVPQENILVNIKAGKCNLIAQPDGKYQVVPDKRKGKIVLKTSGDGLLTFRWEGRSVVNPNAPSDLVEDERIIFANEAKFKRINTGVATDRVYLLSFSTGQKLMYWFQDKDSSTDEELCNKLNDFMNNPTSVAAAISTINSQSQAAPTGGNDEILRMLGLSAAANPSNTARPIQPATTNQSFNGLDLSSILGALSSNAQSGSSSSAQPNTSQIPQRQPLQLQEIFTSEAIINSGVLDDPQLRSELIEQLPEGQRSEEYLEDNIRSPQFQQSLESLSQALLSDGGSSLMANIGVDPSPGTNDLLRGDAIGAFLTSVQAAADAEASSAENSTSSVVESTNPSDSNETGENQDKMEE